MTLPIMTLPIDERIGHQIKRAEQELIAIKNAVLRPVGLNVPQYTVLLVLAEEPGLSGAALARRCLVTPQTMSTVLNTLAIKGLVSRQNHPVHTHIQEARLTRKGRTVLTKADEAAVEVERELAKELTAEELVLLRPPLGRCINQLAVSLQRVKASTASWAGLTHATVPHATVPVARRVAATGSRSPSGAAFLGRPRGRLRATMAPYSKISPPQTPQGSLRFSAVMDSWSRRRAVAGESRCH